MSLPNPHTALPAEPSMIAGSVLPIQRAEELLATLPGVISARIVASPNGAVDEIHILTTTDVTPKQTVRNVESALIAHLGMHVSHKKISVATSEERQSRFGTATIGKPLPPPAPAAATPIVPERVGDDRPGARTGPDPDADLCGGARVGQDGTPNLLRGRGSPPFSEPWRDLPGYAAERRRVVLGRSGGDRKRTFAN